MRIASALSAARAVAALPVRDYGRAVGFYEKTLGFTVEQKHHWPPGTCVVRAGGGTALLLYQQEDTDHERAAALFFVDEIEPVISNLLARGIQFEETESPDVDVVNDELTQDGADPVWFRDSEDNLLGVARKWETWN